MYAQQQNLRAGLVYSLISAACFGFLAILFRLGYAAGLDTGTMLTFRFCSAFLFLTPYIFIFHRKKITATFESFYMAAICGIFFYGIQSYCFAASLQYISASTAGLILYLYPLAVMILTAVFYKNPITPSKLLSLFLIGAGSILVFYDAFTRQMLAKGLVLAIGAMVAFSCYFTYLQKSLTKTDSTIFSYYVIGFTAAQCLVIYRPTTLSFNENQLLICLLLGLVPTVFAIIFLYKAIEKVGSSYSAIFSSIEPAVTVVFSALLLAEHVVFLQIAGMFCIILGIITPNIYGRKPGTVFHSS